MIVLSQPITNHIRNEVAGWFNKPLMQLQLWRLSAGDQGTRDHAIAYTRQAEAKFQELYQTLVTSVRYDMNLDTKKWCVQRIPTFRFQYPGQLGTKEYHRDMDYGHPIQSLNVIV